MTESVRKTNSRLNRAEVGGYVFRALAAAVVACGILQVMHPVFSVSAKYNVGMGSPPEATAANWEQQIRVARMNAILESSVVGGLMAGALSLGKSPCCSTMLRLATGVPWGALVGACSGLLGSIALHWRTPSALPSVGDTVTVQALVLGCLGLGLGMLVGAFQGQKRAAIQCAMAGAFAGAIAGTIYPIAAALLLPAASVEAVVPLGGWVRLLWSGLFATSFALLISAATSPKPAIANSESQTPVSGTSA